MLSEKISILLIVVIHTSIYAQNRKRITEKRNNGTEIFEINTFKDPNLKIDEEKNYVWYSQELGIIRTTEGGYSGNLLDGKYQAFDEKGNLIAQLNFKNGIKDGEEKRWNEEGKLVYKVIWKNGIATYTKFITEDGINWIEWIGEYPQNGTKKKVYNLNGVLISEESEIDGKIEVKIYFPNGQLKEQYTTDIFEYIYGDVFGYYSNGRKRIEWKYDDEGYKIGNWYWYSEEGEIEKTEFYEKSEIFYPNGYLKEKGTYFWDTEKKEQLRDGTWQFYKEDGTLLKIEKYDKGKLVD